MRILITLVIVVFQSLILFGQYEINFKNIDVSANDFYYKNLIVDNIGENIYIKNKSEYYFVSNYDSIHWMPFLLDNQPVKLMDQGIDGKLCAMTSTNEIWLYQNSNWQNLTLNLPLVGKPQWQNIICANQNRIYINTLFQEFYSDDNCLTWVANDSFQFKEINLKYVCPNNIIYILSNFSAWRSIDNGLTYKPLLDDTTRIYYLFANENNGNIYYEKWNGLYFSLDGLTSYEIKDKYYKPIGLDKKNNNLIYYKKNYIYLTNDNNVNFNSYSSNINYNEYNNVLINKKNRIYLFQSDYNFQFNSHLYMSDSIYNKINNLSIKLFLDNNNNCIYDTLDNPIEKDIFLYDIKNNKYNSFSTNNNGLLNINIDTGVYKIFFYLENYKTQKCFNDTFEIKSLNDAYKYNFGFLSDTCSFPILSMNNFYSRKCRGETFNVIINNNWPSVLDSSEIDLILDDRIFVDSISFPSLKLSNNHYLIKFGKLKPFEQKLIFIYSKIDCSVNIGDTLCSSLEIKSKDLCSSFSNFYKINSCNIVLNSYDPNDKSALVNNVVNSKTMQPKDKLGYLIRFQNTGNDTAFRVVVRDTLSELFDISTFQFLSSSHPCRYSIVNNELVFVFDNILLPDSFTNELKSHGYVNFNIQPKSNSEIGQIIENKAYIYFDFNEPIITKSANVNYGTKVNVSDLKNNVRYFPNPATNTINFEIDNFEKGNYQLILYNIYGQEMIKKEIRVFSFNIERPSNCKDGVYFFIIQSVNEKIGYGKILFH